MKTGAGRRPFAAFSLCIVFTLFVWAFSAAAAENRRAILLLPFSAQAQKDITYLQESVRSMLASRLAAEAGVRILDRPAGAAPAGADAVRAAAGKAGADYAVAGNITAIGSSISIDVKAYAPSGDATAESFYATAANEDGVIGAVDKIAGDMAVRLFGKQPVAAPPPQTAGGGASLAPSTAHPLRPFLGSGGGGMFLRPQTVTGAFDFTKSQNFGYAIEAMDVGDADGDGRLEIVLAERNEVKVYKQEPGGKLQQFWSVAVPPILKVHYVSLADLNGDGVEEIYVSAAETYEPSSFAVEWRGKEFVHLFKDEPFYVRTMDIPGEGRKLLGQQAGGNDPILPGIFVCAVEKGKIVKSEKLAVPNYLNIFDFAYADLNGDGGAEIVAINNKSDRLFVLDSGGKVDWISDDYFGGTYRYIGEDLQQDKPLTEAGIGREGMENRIYIPSRIIVADINGDGISDVVVNKNLSSSSRLFQNLKNYPSGELHGLVWNGIGLTELWHTRKIDGYIADYQVEVDPKRRSAQLLVGLVTRGQGFDFFASKRSTVLTYTLDLAKAEEKKPKE